jgi:diacylglycerol O-acyltransferase
VRWFYTRLSAHDAGFLPQDTETQPMHNTVELQVAGDLTERDVAEQLARRVLFAPALHLRLRYPLLFGRPVWVDDPDFAIERHIVSAVALVPDAGPGSAACDRLSMVRLPRDRPLWRVVVGVPAAGTTTLWLQVHHALADGAVFAAALEDLFGATPPQSQPWQPRRAPSRLLLLLILLARRVPMLLQKLARRRGGSPAAAQEPVPAAVAAIRPGARMLDGRVGAGRTTATVEWKIADLKPTRERGASINDICLAAIAAGLRTYLRNRTDGELPPDLLAIVPRNVRRSEEARVVGNRAWSMHIPLPLDIEDPHVLLEAIAASTRAQKSLPHTLGGAGRTFDLSVSNVRWPAPLEVGGHPVVRTVTVAMLQWRLRLAVVMSSYGDDLCICFTADSSAFPDVAALAQATGAALAAYS